MTTPTTPHVTSTDIVKRIIQDGRAQDNTELEIEFTFDAQELGWDDDYIAAAMQSPWFPWLKD